MKRFVPMMLIVALATALLGCSGDIVKQALATPDLQAKVMDMIGGNTDMAGQMVDKLLAGDGKTVVMDKLLGNADAAQALVGKIAANPEMVEKVLTVAVQDPAMKDRIMGFIKGLEAAQPAAAK